MKKWIIGILVSFYVVAFCSQANTPNQIIWSGVASMNVKSIEQKARKYLNLQMRELNGIETKLVQINAGYYKNDKPNLDVTFIHANSFKLLEQNKTLGSTEQYYGVKYYIEFISVKFSPKGEPIKINLRETLLGKDEVESKAQFLETYKSF